MDGPPGLARYSLLLLERAGGQERPALPHGAEMRDERGLCVYGTSSTRRASWPAATRPSGPGGSAPT